MKLEDISKENPFRVPDNYFDNLYDNIQKRIKEDKKPKTINFQFNKFLAVAASIIIFFLIFNPLNISDSIIAESEIVTVDDYLNSSLNYMSDYEIYSLSNSEEVLDNELLGNYIASAYSDYDIYTNLSE